MKEYLAPEIEKVEYDVNDCLTVSGIGKESGSDQKDIWGDLT